MTTYETVLLSVLAITLTLYFLLSIVLIVFVLKLVSQVKLVVNKAEGVIDSVESAAEAVKGASGKLAFFKLLSNIVKMTQKGKK